MQTVSYEADEGGFKPQVSYEDSEDLARSGYDSNANNFRSNNGYQGNDQNGGRNQNGGHANARAGGYNWLNSVIHLVLGLVFFVWYVLD